MSENKETILVRANVEMTAESLQAIVQNAKKLSGKDQGGYYHVDTADMVGRLVSRFLLEKDFESYVKDPGNYPSD